VKKSDKDVTILETSKGFDFNRVDNILKMAKLQRERSEHASPAKGKNT
jgi:hypothetical protein